MKLDRFGSTFQTTEVHENFCSENFEDPGIENLSEILSVFGGKTFNHGLYRVFLPKQVPSAIKSIEGVFPEYRGRIVPFGFDWLRSEERRVGKERMSRWAPLHRQGRRGGNLDR